MACKDVHEQVDVRLGGGGRERGTPETPGSMPLNRPSTTVNGCYICPMHVTTCVLEYSIAHQQIALEHVALSHVSP